MLTVSQLYLFPIKSLGGIAVSSAVVTDRGFANDRRFMLTDENDKFLTIRNFPKMWLLQPSLESEMLRIASLDYKIEDLIIPAQPEGAADRTVTVWKEKVDAHGLGPDANAWFSEVLGIKCRLVYMPDESLRPVEASSGFRPAGKVTSFADAHPFLMIGEASLRDLNERYLANSAPGTDELAMARFRPNIVFTGGAPYQEDEIIDFTINGVSFTGLENCARCNVPNVDPVTGVATSREPLATLSKYRLKDRKIYFGRDLIHTGTGEVRVGDEIILV
ncbi:MOSC domain-containing protein [Persicitalea jodogahamensis]|uniref:MOSC domain-containing protein n=1 Tax=Persicitalea jodogahamensis TaxID=402147 RepID=A0A8J3DAX6_9BACT|nr:MOSC N-terminal beta barrel domain-containing protein [Persicitalea jodogahamensis]GHB83970.1 MOSC domain-containing protein [Persicitalea jodogahamensis]